MKRWREIKIWRLSVSWKIGAEMSGGWTATPPYGVSYGCRFGGLMILWTEPETIESAAE